MSGKVKGVGLFGLIGLVVSSCIGSGVFATTGQLANVASPGSALVAWLICGLGFLFLAMALANLISEEELNEEYIIPMAFDPRVGPAVAAAVAEAARRTGVARI